VTITPAEVLEIAPDVAKPTRTLYCDRCKKWTEHTRGRDGLNRVYKCKCNQKIIHLIFWTMEEE
jgi:hypothetical protein